MLLDFIREIDCSPSALTEGLDAILIAGCEAMKKDKSDKDKNSVIDALVELDVVALTALFVENGILDRSIREAAGIISDDDLCDIYGDDGEYDEDDYDDDGCCGDCDKIDYMDQNGEPIDLSLNGVPPVVRIDMGDYIIAADANGCQVFYTENETLVDDDDKNQPDSIETLMAKPDSISNK